MKNTGLKAAEWLDCQRLLDRHMNIPETTWLLQSTFFDGRHYLTRFGKTSGSKESFFVYDFSKRQQVMLWMLRNSATLVKYKNSPLTSLLVSLVSCACFASVASTASPNILLCSCDRYYGCYTSLSNNLGLNKLLWWTTYCCFSDEDGLVKI